jgi:hypothetical protein
MRCRDARHRKTAEPIDLTDIAAFRYDFSRPRAVSCFDAIWGRPARNDLCLCASRHGVHHLCHTPMSKQKADRAPG